jgi:hypothetical protein
VQKSATFLARFEKGVISMNGHSFLFKMQQKISKREFDKLYWSLLTFLVTIQHNFPFLWFLLLNFMLSRPSTLLSRSPFSTIRTIIKKKYRKTDDGRLYVWFAHFACYLFGKVIFHSNVFLLFVHHPSHKKIFKQKHFMVAL